MTALQYLRAFARGWWIIVLCMLAGTALTLLLDQLATSTYTSTSRVLISPVKTADTSSSEAYSAALLALQRVTSYVDIANGDTLAEDVVDDLDLHLSVAQLEDRIQVSTPTGTTLLNIRVRDPDADQAQRIAAQAAESAVTIIDKLEDTRGQGRPVLRAAVVGQEQPPVAATAAPAWRNPALGAVGGLIVGLGLAVVMARLDPRLRDEDQVIDALGAPVLGVLPGPAGQHLDAVRELRTGLFFMHPGADKCLAVTISSPHAVDEVPQTISAVAAALVDTGARVLLVEGDLHEPRMASLLGLDAQATGLAEYLGGTSTIDDVTRQDSASGFDVVVAGTAPENPADALHSQAMGQLVADTAQRYDFVLVTAPATTVGTDAAALAARCDGVLMMVVRGRTTEPEVLAARTHFERVHAPVLGAVLMSGEAAGQPKAAAPSIRGSDR